jgi:hypothetical protein
MAIDWTKPVQTRDGRKVRVLCTDAPGSQYPVIGLIEGDGDPETWTIGGVYAANGATSNLDIINAPEPAVTLTRWVNVYPDNTVGLPHEEKGGCDFLHRQGRNARGSTMTSVHRIACVPVTFSYRPGEGID